MPSLKYDEIVKIMSNFNLSELSHMNFYESGTYYGTTTLEMQPHFKQIFTIEVSVHIFENTHKYLTQYSNITHINGATEDIIKDIIVNNNQSEFIFFLDGHYSSGDTESSNIHVPLLEELKQINTYYKKKGLIIVDDYNLFKTNGNEDWSNITIDNVLKCFTNNQIYTYFIQNNRMIILLD
jgi:hypothetical protein